MPPGLGSHCRFTPESGSIPCRSRWPVRATYRHEPSAIWEVDRCCGEDRALQRPLGPSFIPRRRSTNPTAATRVRALGWLAGNNRCGIFAFRRLGRRKYCEIAGIALEHVRRHLAVSNRSKLTPQQVDWSTMLRRRPVEIDDADAAAGPQGRCKIVEKRVRLRDLMIHMDEDGQIERGDR